MSNITMIVLTAFLTAFFGTFGVIIGYIIINFVIEPVKKFKAEIGNVSDNLIFWAAALSNPGTHVSKSEAYSAFRKSRSMLQAMSYTIPKYELLSKLGVVPKRKDLDTACRSLTSISNLVTITNELTKTKSIDQIQKDIEILKDKLGIKAYEN